MPLRQEKLSALFKRKPNVSTSTHSDSLPLLPYIPNPKQSEIGALTMTTSGSSAGADAGALATLAASLP